MTIVVKLHCCAIRGVITQTVYKLKGVLSHEDSCGVFEKYLPWFQRCFVALEKLENSEGRIQGWIEEAL